MTQIYNAPKSNVPGSAQSTIGPQFNTHYWDRKALIDAAEDMYFSPLADAKTMPKHFGKEMKVFYYVPLLDELNVTDQGIDAAGAVLNNDHWSVSFPGVSFTVANGDAAAAVTALNANGNAIATSGGADSAGTGNATITLSGTVAVYASDSQKNAVAGLNMGASIEKVNGALYGGSRDIGSITGKMPTLTETGGRVNRVGFTRLERTGSITEYGFFMEFTEDSLMFDTDSDLYGHLSREMLRGANEITEDLLQADLLNAADTKMFPGAATSLGEISGESGSVTELTVTDLKKLSIILDDNRTPKKTTIIKGSRMTDTKVISASRICYIGSESQIFFTELSGYVPVEQYADAGNIMNGEIGAVPGAHLRIVVVPQMMHIAGAGAAESSNGGFQATNGRYDVAPVLIVGDEAFATIGLQGMGGKGKQKFRIIVKKPGVEMATTQDPYGKLGFSSIKFFYGFIKLRGERMAVAYNPIAE